MAKRFTDTNKWSKSWFMDLPTDEKLLWIYLLDTCDHAGIGEINWKLTSFMVGFQVESMPWSFTKQITMINEKKYFIKDFIDFQYGVLSENNRAHNSVIAILKKYNLLEQAPNKPLTSPLQGAKDKDKDKDKDKVKDKVKVKTTTFKKPTLDECKHYFVERNYHNANYEAEKFFDFYESKGWKVGKSPMKNWKSASGNWNRRVQENQSTKGYTAIKAGDEYAEL